MQKENNKQFNSNLTTSNMNFSSFNFRKNLLTYMLFPLTLFLSCERPSSASLPLQGSSLHVTHRCSQEGPIKVSEATSYEKHDQKPFLVDKKGNISCPKNNHHEKKLEKRYHHTYGCLSKCFLFFCFPAMLLASTALAYLKYDSSVLKRGTPLANYLREHGVYSHLEYMEQSIDIPLTSMLNTAQRNFTWISDVGFQSFSDHIMEDLCDKGKVERAIGKFEEHDLVYLDRDFDQKCFFNFFLPKVEEANISIDLIQRSDCSKGFFKKIEKNHAVRTFYTKAENLKYDYVTQKIDVIPWGLNEDVVLRTPLASYFRYDYFGSLAQYQKRVMLLFSRLKEQHKQRAARPIMEVYIDYFGKLIREKCYLLYTDPGSVDKLSGSKRKCTRRSYALLTIKKKIKNYEKLFFISSKQIGQFELFEQRSKYSFLLSTPGDGLDCYRIWEALIFNNIVITQSHPLFDKFIKKHNHQLPIVIVDSYLNITKENLEKWYTSYAHLTSFNNEKTEAYLQLPFWKDYMKHNHSFAV